MPRECLHKKLRRYEFSFTPNGECAGPVWQCKGCGVLFAESALAIKPAPPKIDRALIKANRKAAKTWSV